MVGSGLKAVRVVLGEAARAVGSNQVLQALVEMLTSGLSPKSNGGPLYSAEEKSSVSYGFNEGNILEAIKNGKGNQIVIAEEKRQHPHLGQIKLRS